MRFLLTTLVLLFLGSAAVSAAERTVTERAVDHWSRGDVVSAERLARAALTRVPDDDEARKILITSLAARGRLDEALSQYARLAPDSTAATDLERLVVDMHLAGGREDQAVDFARRRGMGEGRIDWLERRRERPLSVALPSTTVIPFAADNPLRAWMPAVPVEVDGRQIVAHLDTGGPFVAMSPKMAAELGIESTLVGTGVANARETSVEMGLAGRLVLGDAVLENVPVAVLASLEGALRTGDRIEDMVILGTSVLQQFLTTWDNPGQRLVLSPRTDPVARRRHEGVTSPGGSFSPFFLLPDHFLFATAELAGSPRPVLVDSGLVAIDGNLRQAGIQTSPELLAELGVRGTADERGFHEAPISVRLGSAGRDDVLVRTADWSLDRYGLHLPALVGHGFLADYSWTIDFDRRVWSFSSGPLAPEPEIDLVELESPASPADELLPRDDDPAATDSSGATNPTAAVAGPREYVGNYEVIPGVSLTVTSKGDEIFILAPGQPRMALVPRGGARFDVPAVGGLVEFRFDASGSVVDLVLTQGERTTVAEKIN